MVKLMMDVGNSAIKWATLTQKGLEPQQSLLYQQENVIPVLEKIAITLQNQIEAIWISSVVSSETTRSLTQWAHENWGILPVFAKTSGQVGNIRNGYKKPEQLGVDRWLALLAARHLANGQLCIVDCGTAVTLDILSAENEHIGGLIMPGVGLMQQSFMTKTHALKQLADEIPLPTNAPVILARDTASAIILGTLYAVVGWLEYVLSSLEKQKGHFILILTGGNASTLHPLLSKPCQYVPDLVLQGLVTLANDS